MIDGYALIEKRRRDKWLKEQLVRAELVVLNPTGRTVMLARGATHKMRLFDCTSPIDSGRERRYTLDGQMFSPVGKSVIEGECKVVLVREWA